MSYLKTQSYNKALVLRATEISHSLLGIARTGAQNTTVFEHRKRSDDNVSCEKDCRPEVITKVPAILAKPCPDRLFSMHAVKGVDS
jgi:hypothetical protein